MLCVDVRNGGGMRSTVMLICQRSLRLMAGCVRGLKATSSVEPEAACSDAAVLHLPRLVGPYDAAAPRGLDFAFATLRHLLKTHTSDASAALSIDRLVLAYLPLESLYQKYLREALRAVSQSEVPVWHHKLLYAWCAKQQQPPPRDDAVAPSNVRTTAHTELWAEVQLAERCGPRLADALTGAAAYQELLFPGGSMEAVLPVYEDAAYAAFYNGCVVATCGAIASLLPGGRPIRALEIGAGSGGTASSVLPVLENVCEQYTFTDVSEVFLRQARVRFASFPFLEYALLNVDADPRLQGFATRQCQIIIATNVLHATPFMRNTLRHCEQLLRTGGMLVINEALATAFFVQITFGMTDGWWLFGESRDAERIGQDSPLLSWRQWQALLDDSGFLETFCVEGEAFFRGQGVVIAQNGESSCRPLWRCTVLDGGTHLISGGLGGLGLLRARLLIECGARHIVLSSRSNRVMAGSEEDWGWLARSGGGVRRVRCDAADESAARAIAHSLCGDALRLVGVFHAAHALADAVITNQHALNFCVTYGPKAHGAAALHAVFSRTPLDFFSLFSSIGGLLGSAGQAPHSAANAWLDTMAGWRCQHGVRGQSVNWGPVSEIGYAARHGADRRAEVSGYGAVSRAVALAALRSTLLPECRSLAVLPIDWSRLLAGTDTARGCLAPYFHLRDYAPRAPMEACGACTSTSRVSTTTAAAGAVSVEAIRPHTQTSHLAVAESRIDLEVVLEIVRRTAGSFVDVDAPLMEAGVDSLGVVELRNQLQLATGDLTSSLPATLTLDYPTARLLAAFFGAKPACTQERHRFSLASLAVGGGAVLCGTGVLLPSGVSRLEQLWHQCMASVDNIEHVPSARWDCLGGGSDTLKGASSGFVAAVWGAQCFDSTSFQVSKIEAASIDPMQRLLLEKGYEALQNATLNRARLLGYNVGVFLGVDKCDWTFVRPVSTLSSVYALSSAINSIAAGRLSFALGLQGPCVTYDTACSSALVSIHGGTRALQLGECDYAVAEGVNLCLHPSMHAAFFYANLASATGMPIVLETALSGASFLTSMDRSSCLQASHTCLILALMEWAEEKRAAPCCCKQAMGRILPSL